MLNLESRPLFFTISLKTPSAAGLRQMFPRQTNKTEKGLLSVLCVGVAIGEDDAKHETEGEILGFSRKLKTRFGFLRDWRLTDRKVDAKWQGRGSNRVEWQKGEYERIVGELMSLEQYFNGFVILWKLGNFGYWVFSTLGLSGQTKKGKKRTDPTEIELNEIEHKPN